MRSPTPEPLNTGASSPSAAYAHLTLDSEGGTESAATEPTRPKGRVNSLTTLETNGGYFSTARASSPAKRQASEMEETDGRCTQDVDMDDNLSLNVQDEQMSKLRGIRAKAQSVGTRHKREMSLDPLATDGDPSCEENTNRDQTPFSKENVVTGSYNTPQFGSATRTSGSGASPIPPTAAKPSIDEQINMVMQMTQKPPQEGQKGYAVSYAWLSRVLVRGTNSEFTSRFSKDIGEGEVGPVDNSDLEVVWDRSYKDEKGEIYVPIKSDKNMGEHYEILAKEAWDLIISWYGLAQGSPIITRYCHNTSTSDVQEHLQYEITPPIFTVLKIPETPGPAQFTRDVYESDMEAVVTMASRSENFQSFLKRAKQAAGIDRKTRVRVWRVLDGLGESCKNGMITPAQSRSASPSGNNPTVIAGLKLVLDVNRFASLQLGSQRELVDVADQTFNENYNGHSTLNFVGLGQDGIIVLEEQIGGPAGGEWVADVAIGKAKANEVPISITKNGTTSVQDNLKAKASTSRAASPASVGMMTRGRARKDGRVRGTTGLSNLGNTCYMNSALQCVKSCEELTQYFLQDRYKKELNPSNPLSHEGNFAKAYAQLLKDLFGDSNMFSFAPRNIKNVVGRYGSNFSGYGQQDSQEFLLFLLDGLHEDLNRIQQKPYIEKPDSTDEMVDNPVALREMADKCWDIYRARNDSVVTDLFAGMYKSTVVCPKCDKVSIIFDPFNNLTLQLPIDTVIERTIFFFPLNGKPIQLGVEVEKSASIMDLKEAVAKKMAFDARKSILGDVYKARFYKIFDDNTALAESGIQDTDKIALMELEDVPGNWSAWEQRKSSSRLGLVDRQLDPEDNETESGNEEAPRDAEGKKPQSPQSANRSLRPSNKIPITVLNRYPNRTRMRHRDEPTIFGIPSVILLTPEEAMSYDTILRKVLVKVVTLTTRDFLGEIMDEDNPSPEDSDTVLMSTEDGDSSSDSKIQAKSLNSEDGMVDISMGNAGETSQAAPRESSSKPIANTRPQPAILRPGSSIPSVVRDLFTMKFNPSSGSHDDSGWASIMDDAKDFETIASRLPQPTNEEEVDEPSQSASLAEVDDLSSSSDSDGLPPVQRVIHGPQQSFSRFQNISRKRGELITYSRKDKGSKNAGRTQATSRAKDELLIFPGEQIVLEWSAESYDALFGGTRYSKDEQLRGAPTWELIPQREDPELLENRQRRLKRKKNGFTLDECLDEFGKPEILAASDTWYCPRCKDHRRARKTFQIWKAPDILVIHLKRFSAHSRWSSNKLDIHVSFPVEGLDLTSRLLGQEEDKDAIYDLFAVDNHYGGTMGGHYTAFAKNFFDQNWYEYNDSSVSRKGNAQAVVTTAAYLLFYRRRSSVPLGGPFFEPIIRAGEETTASGSQPTSRAGSPSGEGKRLDESSRNGLSGALRGVGAAHQAGGGGLEDGAAQRRTGVDDELPSYTTLDMDGKDTQLTTDVDEGYADISGHLHSIRPQWSFNGINQDEDNLDHVQTIRAPPGSDDGDEGLFDGDSNKAASTPDSEPSARLAIDFIEDEGTTSGAFDRPMRGDTPVQVEPPLLDEEDEPIAELTPPDGDPMFKD
ncbi:MAG: hypothetical protein LQ342_004208 [Letrouitia transgressa]|nr:MAG: hypothetical protein LQ342_004208 [Letrouitia transgressa]